MKRMLGCGRWYALAAVLGAALAAAGCDTGEDGENESAGFVAVTGISGVPEKAYLETPLALSGTVEPADATHKTIIWSGDGVANGVLTAKKTGTVTVTATIARGKSGGADYIQTFQISVPTPRVSGVTVSGPSVAVIGGSPAAFTAVVTGEDGPPQGVTWTVTGSAIAIADTGTMITTTGGLLVVAGVPHDATLTVKAVSQFDDKHSGSVDVRVFDTIAVKSETAAAAKAVESATGAAGVKRALDGVRVVKAAENFATVITDTEATLPKAKRVIKTLLNAITASDPDETAEAAEALAAVLTIMGCGGSPADGGALSLEAQKEMVSIPARTIKGSGEEGAFPQGRTVTLSAYSVAKYETTWTLWKAVADWNSAAGGDYAIPAKVFKGSSDSGSGSQPVTYMTWPDIIVWCNAYSEVSGKTAVYYSDAGCTQVITSLFDNEVYMKRGASGYRLPTEAEWEAAARGGDSAAEAWNYTYAGSNTLDEVAQYGNDFEIDTYPVGEKRANSAGLYDMSGNVWEWCFDWFAKDIAKETVTNPPGAQSGTSRALRGGCWLDKPDYCAVSGRFGCDPTYRYPNMGFRVVCAP